MVSASPPDDRSVLAAELALGLLDGDALQQARALQRDDVNFADEVDAWVRHFELLFAQWPAHEAPASLLRRVQAAAGITAANDNRSTFWKWTTAGASAVAAALAIAMLNQPVVRTLPPTPLEVAPRTIAVAFDLGDEPGAVPALVNLTDRRIRVSTGLDIPAGRIAQLWLIEGQEAPKPIGLFERSGNGLTATITLDRDLPAGAVLAISIEPPGGSPTGLPTGPVVATGQINPV